MWVLCIWLEGFRSRFGCCGYGFDGLLVWKWGFIEYLIEIICMTVMRVKRKWIVRMLRL